MQNLNSELKNISFYQYRSKQSEHLNADLKKQKNELVIYTKLERLSQHSPPKSPSLRLMSQRGGL